MRGRGAAPGQLQDRHALRIQLVSRRCARATPTQHELDAVALGLFSRLRPACRGVVIRKSHQVKVSVTRSLLDEHDRGGRPVALDGMGVGIDAQVPGLYRGPLASQRRDREAAEPRARPSRPLTSVD